MSDGGWKLVVETQELTPQQVASVAQLKEKIGWFLFSENTINKIDIPDDPAPEFAGEKSLSERFRAVMFVFWNTKTDKKKTFDEFRKEKMEQLIEFWKGKLD